MSHTNSTTNYALPQFLTSDKPAWLTDVNNAFADIDTAVYSAQTKADTAYTDAGNAQLDATTAINNAAAADAKGSGALASIETAFDPTTIYSVGAKVIYNSLLYRCIVAVVTPGPWTGSDNWERITVDSLISSTDSKVGLLSSLSTTDKTSIVNAVNEVNGDVVDLEDVTDISSAFVANPGISNYDFFVRAYYNKGLRKISGSFSCRVTSGTLGTAPMCTIDSAYRPTNNTGFPIVGTLSGATTFYYCTIATNGQITQNLSSNLTGVFCNFEYYI